VHQRMVGLVVADQQLILAEGLGILLDRQDDLTVLGLAHDRARAVLLAAERRPAALLLDADLPGGPPAETVAAVRAASPATKVLLLSAEASSGAVAAAIAAGAEGLVAKDASCRQLVAAIREVVTGGRVMVVGAELPRFVRDSRVALWRLGTLSGRERQLLGLLARGWSTRRIAREWRVAESTVRSHVQHLLEKLAVRSKLEAAALAWEHGAAAAEGMAPGDHDRAKRPQAT
jgi:two-component system, NarL family, nitrate/nitrite response regulator NarL